MVVKCKVTTNSHPCIKDSDINPLHHAQRHFGQSASYLENDTYHSLNNYNLAVPLIRGSLVPVTDQNSPLFKTILHIGRLSKI